MQIVTTCVLALIAGLAGPVLAQSLHQCVDKRGHVSLTSAPCPAGHKTQKVVDATPERISPERAAHLEQRRRQEAAHSAYLRKLAGHGSARYRSPQPAARASDDRSSRCEAAKARRTTTLERVGLRRTHDLLRQLDDAVYRACK